MLFRSISYDPTFAHEVAVIMQHGLYRMVEKQENVFYYLTLLNENYAMPGLTPGTEAQIIKGMYLCKPGPKGKAKDPRVQLLGSGTILRESISAQALLATDWGIASDVWSCPSFNELARDGQDAERHNLLNPTQPPRVPFVAQQLEGHAGPIVASTDYMKNYAEQIRPFVPRERIFKVLGTDGFGRSDFRSKLREHFEVNRHYIVVAALKALVLSERAARLGAEAEAQLRAIEIETLKLQIAKLRRERYAPSSENAARLEQLELALADLEETASERATAAEVAAQAVSDVPVRAFTRQKPARRPLPEHLPRERVVYPAPAACPCCGGTLRKLGEDVTETLEHVPARWKVIQHVREKFSCRACEAIAQPPAPSHPIARGRAGPGLLAQVLFSKYGAHLPLNRQSAIYAREGIDLDVSTLADWVGAAAATLMPLVEAVRAHIFTAARIHADDTPVPVLAKGKTRTGRLWTYVRDDRPFAGCDPPAAAFFYSPDRSGKHPEQHLVCYAGIMQADAYAGFNRLYDARRRPGPIIEAACWAHARRKF